MAKSNNKSDTNAEQNLQDLVNQQAEQMKLMQERLDKMQKLQEEKEEQEVKQKQDNKKNIELFDKIYRVLHGVAPVIFAYNDEHQPITIERNQDFIREMIVLKTLEKRSLSLETRKAAEKIKHAILSDQNFIEHQEIKYKDCTDLTSKFDDLERQYPHITTPRILDMLKQSIIDNELTEFYEIN